MLENWFHMRFSRKIKKICETEYSDKLPGYSSTKKFLQITGYPGNRYSALDTLVRIQEMELWALVKDTKLLTLLVDLYYQYAILRMT